MAIATRAVPVRVFPLSRRCITPMDSRMSPAVSRLFGSWLTPGHVAVRRIGPCRSRAPNVDLFAASNTYRTDGAVRIPAASARCGSVLCLPRISAMRSRNIAA